MERAVFAARLADASRRAVELAHGYVIETLPDEVRFALKLNASYDGHPLHPDETVYPDEGHPSAAASLARIDHERAVDLLWRNGTVPEWIDVAVDSADDEVTLIELTVCGSFTANSCRSS